MIVKIPPVQSPASLQIWPVSRCWRLETRDCNLNKSSKNNGLRKIPVSSFQMLETASGNWIIQAISMPYTQSPVSRYPP